MLVLFMLLLLGLVAEMDNIVFVFIVVVFRISIDVVLAHVYFFQIIFVNVDHLLYFFIGVSIVRHNPGLLLLCGPSSAADQFGHTYLSMNKTKMKTAVPTICTYFFAEPANAPNVSIRGYSRNRAMTDTQKNAAKATDTAD